MTRTTTADIQTMKHNRKPVVMLTAYDFAWAQIVDEAGVDIILVGDSLANVALGYEKTNEVTMEEMIHHTKAVSRAVRRALLVGDMPYVAYQKDIESAVENAKRFVDEGGAQAIKLEWFNRSVEVASQIAGAGIPVMGHVGLTPQTAHEFKVQGKDKESARQIFNQAKEFEKAGVFSLVLECIPDLLAKKISEHLSIPTIGIGSGIHCDGQVLVTNDLLGLQDKFKPKFVKRYADVKGASLDAIRKFSDDVRNLKFPDDAHSYHIGSDQMQESKG